LCHTIQQRTVLIIFPLNLQITITLDDVKQRAGEKLTERPVAIRNLETVN